MPPAVADPESGERVVKELPALMDGSAADTDTPDTSAQEVHKPKHVVGIIYPPPEVRSILFRPWTRTSTATGPPVVNICLLKLSDFYYWARITCFHR